MELVKQKASTGRNKSMGFKSFVDQIRQHPVWSVIAYTVACVGITWAVSYALYVGPREFDISQKKEFISELLQNVSKLREENTNLGNQLTRLQEETRNFKEKSNNLIKNTNKGGPPEEKITIEGHVFNQKGTPIYDAQVFISGAERPESTGDSGYFILHVLKRPSQETAELTVTEEAYEAYFDTIKLDESPIYKKITLKLKP